MSKKLGQCHYAGRTLGYPPTVRCGGIGTSTFHDARGCRDVCPMHFQWLSKQSRAGGHGVDLRGRCASNGYRPNATVQAAHAMSARLRAQRYRAKLADRGLCPCGRTLEPKYAYCAHCRAAGAVRARAAYKRRKEKGLQP